MNRIPKPLYPPAWPLTVKLLLMLLAVALVPLGLTTYYNLQESLTVLKQNENRRLEMLATNTASRLNELIQGVKLVSIQLSTRSEVISFLSAERSAEQEPFRADVQATLQNLQNNYPVRSVYLLDRKGIIRATSQSRNLGENNSFRGFFRTAMSGKVYVSSLLLDARSRQPNLFFAAPVRDDRNEVVGVAVIVFKGERVWEILEEVQTGTDGFTILVDRFGVMVGHPNRELIYSSLVPLSANDLREVQRDNDFGIAQVNSLNLPTLARSIVGAKNPGYTEYKSQDAWKILGYAPLNRAPYWTVGVAYHKADLEAPVLRLIQQNILTGLMIGGGTIVVALLLSRYLVRPIRRLIVAAQDLKQGRLDFEKLQQLPRGQDDVGQLVDVFISMAEDVQVRESGLRQQVNELSSQIEVARQQRTATGELAYFRQLQQRVKELRTATAGQIDGEDRR